MDIFPFAPEVGYIGLSLVSFFGSLIPFVPIPSFVLLATMAVGEQFNIHLLALFAALTSNFSCGVDLPIPIEPSIYEYP